MQKRKGFAKKDFLWPFLNLNWTVQNVRYKSCCTNKYVRTCVWNKEALTSLSFLHITLVICWAVKLVLKNAKWSPLVFQSAVFFGCKKKLFFQKHFCKQDVAFFSQCLSAYKSCTWMNDHFFDFLAIFQKFSFKITLWIIFCYNFLK